jgi:hypothetical protein
VFRRQRSPVAVVLTTQPVHTDQRKRPYFDIKILTMTEAGKRPQVMGRRTTPFMVGDRLLIACRYKGI